LIKSGLEGSITWVTKEVVEVESVVGTLYFFFSEVSRIDGYLKRVTGCVSCNRISGGIGVSRNGRTGHKLIWKDPNVDVLFRTVAEETTGGVHDAE